MYRFFIVEAVLQNLPLRFTLTQLSIDTGTGGQKNYLTGTHEGMRSQRALSIDFIPRLKCDSSSFGEEQGVGRDLKGSSRKVPSGKHEDIKLSFPQL